MTNKKKNKWKEAMHEEHKSLLENNTWKLVCTQAKNIGYKMGIRN